MQAFGEPRAAALVLQPPVPARSEKPAMWKPASALAEHNGQHPSPSPGAGGCLRAQSRAPPAPASPCSAVAPAPATPGGCRCSRRGRGLPGGVFAGLQGAGGWIPVESELCYWWIQAGEGAGSSQSEADCGDPKGIVQVAADGGVDRGRRRGGGTTSPSSPLAGGDLGIPPEPIAAQLPSGFLQAANRSPALRCAGDHAGGQSGCRSPRALR